MENKKITLLTIILLAISTVYIFTMGDLRYRKASVGTVNFGFKNNQLSFNQPESLDFLIENKNNGSINFSVYFKINGKETAKEEISVEKNEPRMISAPEKVKQYIEENRNNFEKMRYEIRLAWNGKEESIYKIIDFE